MVRIKHRYLLLNFLYSSPSTSTSALSKPSTDTPSYLSLHAPTPSYLTPALLISHLRDSITAHFGDTALGLTSASLRVVYLSPATSTAIIRCPRAHVKLVWASLTYMTHLPGARRQEKGIDCVVRVVRVSGTIRKSEEELIRRASGEVVRAKRAQEEGEADVFAKLIGGTAPPPISVSLEDEEVDYGSASSGE